METGSNVAGGVKAVFKVRDESLDTNLEGDLHLSIQRGEGALAWALLLTRQNKYLALESYAYAKSGETELLEELKKTAWFNNVSSVSLSCVSAQVTLVPEPLFDEKAQDSYSNFNFSGSINQSVIGAKVRSAGCYAVFALPQETEQLYRKTFPGIKIMHCAMPLLESILTNTKNESSEKAYINIRAKSFELVVARGGTLLYYNTFSYTTNEDVIYYLLFTFEQLKLNPENISLQLLGEIEKNDGVYPIIHKYVRNVSFMQRNARFDYSYRFSELPEHAFYSLFSQHLCV